MIISNIPVFKNVILNSKIKTSNYSTLPFTSQYRQIEELSSVPIPYEVKKPLLASDKTRLGANYNPETKTVDFKLMSKNATDVYLCLFDKAKGETPSKVIKMEKDDEGTWSAQIKHDSKTPLYYGYRVFGSNWEYSEDFFDEKGNIKNSKAGFKTTLGNDGSRFNPNKLAYDPYSKELSHLPSDNPTSSQDIFYTYQNQFEDNSRYAPKSVFAPVSDSLISKASKRPLTDEIIGEVHIKDLSINEDVKNPGTFLGAAQMVSKIKEMGITMVEFLPVNEFDEKEGQGNYWGYMPLTYFAPAKKYAADKTDGSALKEFREMIDELHKNNIKVCLDVVYNHTGEAATKSGNIEDAKLLSYALIDNQTYYKQNGDYNSNSGCGNDFNTANSETADLIADSIAFWANQGVDAFRFDLAAALLDSDSSHQVFYDSQKGLASKLTNMLQQRGIKVNSPNEKGDGIYLIAEPWTCGGDWTYHLGDFPDNWAEWNDKNREALKGVSLFPTHLRPRKLQQALEGNSEILRDPKRSLNYVFSHDGYTLNDSNSYKSPEGSWSYATDFDGDTDKQINAMKKEIALVLLSKGTPMFQIGDLIAHSKGGNENTYNLDNETNYLDFSKTEVEGSKEQEIYDFSRKMIEFRKTHKCLRDLSSIFRYYDEFGNERAQDSDYWDKKEPHMFCFKIGDKKPVYVSISNTDEYKDVVLPRPGEGKGWRVVLDTSMRDSFSNHNYCANYIQRPGSIVVFEEG